AGDVAGVNAHRLGCLQQRIEIDAVPLAEPQAREVDVVDVDRTRAAECVQQAGVEEVLCAVRVAYRVLRLVPAVTSRALLTLVDTAQLPAVLDVFAEAHTPSFARSASIAAMISSSRKRVAQPNFSGCGSTPRLTN